MRTVSRACFFFICACCIAVMSYGGDAFPPPELIGTWEGISKFSRRGVQELATVSITILPDGSVEGMAGAAKFSRCLVKKNRGWLGRKLNIKTDYIIRGYLEGSVVPKDSGGIRKIAMPFTIRDGTLVGGLGALTQCWWECCPAWLFSRLSLPKKQ
ncbi:MAG: hypothetical protein NTX71_07915 [Candidatus Aureabacteria bacterium]|nr:hypothetical protein [Candidatus Auribacterota bacterium]